MKTILDSIDEQVELIKLILNSEEDAELDMAEIEKVLIDTRVEIEEKNVKIVELEEKAEKLTEKSGELKKTLGITNLSLEKSKEENIELKNVLIEDIRQKLVWLKEEDVKNPEKIDTPALLLMKKETDKKFNTTFEVTPPEIKKEDEVSDSQLNSFNSF